MIVLVNKSVYLYTTPLIKHYSSSSCGVNNIHSNTKTNLKFKEISEYIPSFGTESSVIPSTVHSIPFHSIFRVHLSAPIPAIPFPSLPIPNGQRTTDRQAGIGPE